MPWGSGEPLIKSPFSIGPKNEFSKLPHHYFDAFLTVTVYGFQKVWVRFNLLFIIKIKNTHFESANNLFFKHNVQSNP